QFFEHGLIMNQVSQNGEWLMDGFLKRQCNRVADAKAHAEMFCANYFHKKELLKPEVSERWEAGITNTLHYKVLRRTSLVFVQNHGYLPLVCWMISSSRLM